MSLPSNHTRRVYVLRDQQVLCQKHAGHYHPLMLTVPADVLDLRYHTHSVPVAPVLRYPSAFCTHHSSANLVDTPEAKSVAAHTHAATYAVSAAFAHQHAIDAPVDLSITDDRGDLAEFVPYRTLLMDIDSRTADQISQAIQLLRWQADTQFCSRCGAPVVSAALGERAMVCPHCALRQYPRVQPCVITAITRPNPDTGITQILLAHHHRYGTSSLPLRYGLIAGFVEVGESLEHAVVREVREEVGITLTGITYISSQPWPYPSNLMLGFRADYASGTLSLQEDELSHADFFDITDLPNIPSKGSIAYDLIAQIAQENGVCV